MQSSMYSEYHGWFVDMGYPQLDIVKYEDGEWSIIEFQNEPVVPSLTKFRHVLTGLRNILITKGFCEKYVRQLDPNRKEFLALEDAKSQAVEVEHEARERHSAELADKATEAITKNPDLMERIATNGFKEMRLSKILKHIPRWKF